MSLANEYVGVVKSIRGLTVEVQIVGVKPEINELLTIEGFPKIFSIFAGLASLN